MTSVFGRWTSGFVWDVPRTFGVVWVEEALAELLFVICGSIGYSVLTLERSF